MGRPKGDQRYRNEVTIIEENKEWNCNHCKRTFCGGFSRIKAHLDKIQGKGISICSVYCGNEGMHNTSSSINPQEAINTLNPLQGSVAEHGVNRSSNGDGALTTFQSKLNELVSDLTREKEDIKGQIQWLESWGKKRKSDVDTWLNQLQDLKKRAVHMKNSLNVYDLVRKLVEGGVLNGKKSLREIVDEGHIIINKLIDHSLLLLAEVDGYIGINGLVRNTACQSHSYMVKCGEGLRKIPHVREWTSDLETVSLAGNRIKEIPEGISPDCACLSTLILSDNQISHIAECFFTHMNALTVLDLSDNGTLTSLPHSLSNLSSCASCTNIQTLSPRGMFSHLKKFNIEGCHEIETLLTPGLVSQLQNLESISVFDCNSMKEIFAVGSGLVPQLTNLKSITVSHCNSMKEIFAVSYSGDDESFNIELPKLTKLELECLPESTTVGIGVSENIVDIHDLKKRAVDMNDSMEQLFGSADYDELDIWQLTEEVRKQEEIQQLA
ncbi:Disease resistance protein [Spatholobus suberectus]|nr:Disease resistance protein [Spatholobus suberectus]